jgi:GNAT superfamily N-acetyltransferase
MRSLVPNPSAVRVSTLDADWQRHYRSTVSSTLDRATVWVAADPDDDGTIYGFAVSEPDVPRFVYVRRAWRGLGIARALLSPIEVTRRRMLNWTMYLAGYVRESSASQEILRLAQRAKQESHGKRVE